MADDEAVPSSTAEREKLARVRAQAALHPQRTLRLHTYPDGDPILVNWNRITLATSGGSGDDTFTYLYRKYTPESPIAVEESLDSIYALLTGTANNA